ncbi:hypothetical protein BTR14_20325 [Rhizobium rhizosphaerae]|uniref:Nuclease n=1 Tax=Xaviernesmea rhizosphaerae TaxID=1672749 RepID=A0ABX3P972_9HYPH|nr:thermonuclease family protein [Xaviernesmea rhizosphaerae]OQP84156.1 hypothetical protein BTR14_20325 [Xaviernesmea rhizosphaerae]
MAKARRTPGKTTTTRAKSPRGKTRSGSRGGVGLAGWLGVGLVALGGIVAYDHRDLLPDGLLTSASRQVAALAVSTPAGKASAPNTDTSLPTASIPKPAARPAAQAGAGIQSVAAHGAITLPAARAPLQAAANPVPGPVPGPRPPMPIDAAPTAVGIAPAQVAAVAPVTLSPVMTPEAAEAAALPKTFYFCGIRTDNCVINGSTFVYRGNKIHLADIDAPNAAAPKCEEERKRGFYAKERLMALLNAGPIEIASAGGGPIVTRSGRSLGQQMVAEGLARPAGTRTSWCGGA